MDAILNIRIQKLFMIAVILKVVSAFLGWYLQLQWSLGLILPLTVMATYIALGLKRKDRDVSDEKFADTCYYLGFIFTITAIVFSLFDLPYIGERIQDIAVRFGAAMVSTVFGLAVRVYLVSFRPDFNDALQDVEDSVLEATNKFREQLVMAYEKLGDFHSQVTTATQTSVEVVKLQVEKLAQDHSARLERVFVELNERNQQAVTQTLAEVLTASTRMVGSVDNYAESMKNNLQSLENRVDEYGAVLMERLTTTTFPDDYFASRLAAPLEQLNSASSDLSTQVQTAANAAGQSAIVLAAAIRKLNTKAAQVEDSLDTVLRISNAQRSLVDTSAEQLTQMQLLGELLRDVRLALNATNQTSNSNLEIQRQVSSALSAVEASHTVVVAGMEQVSSHLSAEVPESVAKLKSVADRLDALVLSLLPSTVRLEEDVLEKPLHQSGMSLQQPISLGSEDAIPVKLTPEDRTILRNSTSSTPDVPGILTNIHGNGLGTGGKQG